MLFGSTNLTEPFSATSVSIEIRDASPDDTEQVLELMEPFVVAKHLLRRTEGEIRELTRHGFVAEVNEQIVGFAAVEIYSRKLAEVQCLAVRGDMQGHGLGRRLVAECVDRARELGVLEVMAISSSDNFLLSCGFDYSLPDQKRVLFYPLRNRHDDEPDEDHLGNDLP
jgi:amino-acid N-acetyltransferase